LRRVELRLVVRSCPERNCGQVCVTYNTSDFVFFCFCLAGVGDTFGTCFGPLSRNRKFGYRLGKGESMQDILASSTEVAEGVATSIALVNLIKTRCNGYRLDLKYPILFGVASILEGNLTPLDGLKGIMNMPYQMESFDEKM
jgi:glycerol-3-phosphate dehydrogenase (NAD+)